MFFIDEFLKRYINQFRKLDTDNHEEIYRHNEYYVHSRTQHHEYNYADS